MSKQTAVSLFILSLSSEAKSAELYQGLVRGISSYRQLGNRLIQLAEQSHAFRRFDRVREMGLMLSNIPVKRYQAIGHYFLAVAANSKGNGDQDKAKQLFELTFDTAPDDYKVKSVLSLGALACNKQDFDSALHYYRETIRAGKLSAASLHAIKAISVIKAVEGNHRQALKDLESLLPVIKYAPAHVYFDLLNSYAVELGEVGRKDEARNVSRVVLASPFAFAYPEWQQTAADLQGGSRSLVQVLGSCPDSTSPGNVLSMTPAPERVVESPPDQPAKVFNLAEWKEKMVKEQNNEPDENIDALEKSDLIVRLLEWTTKDDVDEEKLRKVLKYTRKLRTSK